MTPTQEEIAELVRLLRIVDAYDYDAALNENGDVDFAGKAADALEALTTWQPISELSSAPEGHRLLAYNKDWRSPIETMRPKDGKPFVIGGAFHFDMEPATHFFVVPAPPASKEGRGET